MIYSLLRPLLFRLDPETAHQLTLTALRTVGTLGLWPHIPKHQRTLMGLTFPNPVGLSAGFDKNAEAVAALGTLGFGFVEVGTVTPRPQPGNPRPRVFRLPDAQALINRLGFNNKGLDALVARLVANPYPGVLGVNIGKNKDTPLENAGDDYRLCLEAVYPYAHYVTVNVSSPNTPGLRGLQETDVLQRLLEPLKALQQRLATEQGRYVPLVVKLAPDLLLESIPELARMIKDQGIDGLIATNTTIGRPGVEHLPIAAESGGMSGGPLREQAMVVLRCLREETDLPIIAAGGILSGADAQARQQAGADLVQLYTGLVYRGPMLIREVAEALG